MRLPLALTPPVSGGWSGLGRADGREGGGESVRSERRHFGEWLRIFGQKNALKCQGQT